jgi:hypothetical protein
MTNFEFQAVASFLTVLLTVVMARCAFPVAIRGGF